MSATVWLDTMFYAAVAPLLPSYEEQFGLSKTAAGVLNASYPAGTLIASLPAGYMAGRFGAKPTTILGLALLCVSSVTFGLADDIVVLDGARLLQGFGGACSWAGGLAWLIGGAPAERRGELIGAALGAAVFGILLGPVIGSAAAQTSPELVFSAVAALAAALLTTAVLTASAPTGQRSGWNTLREALRNRGLRTALWVFALPALFSGVFGVLAPLRLDDLGAGTVTIGAMFLAGAAIEAVLNPVLGRLSDRRGRMPFVLAGLATGGAFAIVLPLPNVASLLFVVGVGATTGMALLWAPGAALLSDAAERAGLDQGFAFGLMNLAWAGGQVSGGGAGARLADLTADAVPYAMLALVFAVTLLALSRSSATAPSPRRDRA